MKENFRIMGRLNHTSKVWNEGLFTKRCAANRQVILILTPLRGKAVIYRVEKF